MSKALKTWMGIAVGVMALLLTGAQAHALSQLNFGVIGPTTGSISFAGGVAPLVGAGIEVDNVVGLPGGTTVACAGCSLDFTTGPLTGTTGTSWDFGGGATSSITLTGSVPGAGITTPVVLLSGSFGVVNVTNFGGTFKIAGASFSDIKDPALLAFFGLPTGIPYDGNFNISFMAAGTPPGGFNSSAVLSGDIGNTPNLATSPVPEPTAALVFGTALLVIGVSKPRRPTA